MTAALWEASALKLSSSEFIQLEFKLAAELYNDERLRLACVEASETDLHARKLPGPALSGGTFTTLITGTFGSEWTASRLWPVKAWISLTRLWHGPTIPTLEF